MSRPITMATTTLSELRSILGDWMLGELIGPPSASVPKGSTPTMPPEMACRIQLIGEVVWCLLGAYDDEGIRRWFGRRCPQLNGRSPAEHLGTDWVADSPAAKRILDLAKELTSTGSGGT